MNIFCGFKSRNDLDEVFHENLQSLGYNSKLYRYLHRKQLTNRVSLFIDLDSKFATFLVNLLFPTFIIKLIFILLKNDMFIFFAGYSLFSFPLRWKVFNKVRYFDLLLLKLLNKKIIYVFQGSELRYKKKSPDDIGAGKTPVEILRVLASSDIVFVSTADLLSFIPTRFHHKCHVVYRPVTPSHIDYISNTNSDAKIIKVLHAPTNPVLKGTDIIEAAIEKINKSSNLEIELLVLTGVSKKVIYEKARQCDLALDQLLLGWYGVFTLEMIELGVPVMCYLNEEAVELSGLKRDELPILQVAVESIEKDILDAVEKIRNKAWVKNHIDEQKKFIETVHSANAFKSTLISAFERIR